MEPTLETAEEIVRFLVGWLACHIIDSDKRMAYAVEAINQGATIEQAKEQANEVMSGKLHEIVEGVYGMHENISPRSLQQLKNRIERMEFVEAFRCFGDEE